MDTSIVGVALPEIQRAAGLSQSDLSWVFNSYVIALGGLLLLALFAGIQAAFLGAAAIALVGAGVVAVWLRQPRAAFAPEPAVRGINAHQAAD